MIGRLSGVIVEKKAPKLIIDIHGVGYEVFVPLSIFEKLPDLNEVCTLKIKQIFKETDSSLYGFLEDHEKDLFEMMISVNGIGDKSVLKFMSSFSASDIRKWILDNDLKNLVKLPGLGNKTASKVLIELNGKLVAIEDDKVEYDENALAVLMSFGYSEKDAKAAVKKYSINKKNPKTEDIIKAVMANN